MLITLTDTAKAIVGAIKAVTSNGVVNKETSLKVSSNLIELMDDFIIEPLILLSEDLKRSDKVEDIIKLQTDMFTTYVTTGFDILLNVYKIPAEKVISAMTNKSLDVSQVARFGYESLEKDSTVPLQLFDTESDTLGNQAVNMEVKEIRYNTKDGKDITFKVMIRPTIEYVDKDTVTKLLTEGIVDDSFFNRLDKYSAGLLDASGFYFNVDLMKQYKKNRLKDGTDVIKVINERKLSSDVARVTNDMPNMSEYYQMIIVSTDVSKEIEMELGKKLVKPNVSKRVMSYSRSLTLTVMDDTYERCVIFVNGIKGHVDISYKALSKGKSNSELTEVLKFLLNK